MILVVVSLTIWTTARICEASAGDTSLIFNECLDSCIRVNCTTRIVGDTRKSRHDLNQPLHLALLGWTCRDECNYWCMWSTVDQFVNVYGNKVPQFFGKWPFVRFMGIQEPASVLASLLNLFVTVRMVRKFHRQIKMSRRTPLKFLW